MQLLISDSNIIIDLEEGGITEEFFQLPYEIAIPDILFAEELEKNHGELLERGLQIKELSAETLQDAFWIMSIYPRPSRNDCFALMLARQENCPLLTGDRDLRSAAEKEGIIVMGTIWIVEQMVTQRILTKGEAEKSYRLMKENNRRLPWETAFRRLGKM